MKKLFFTAIIGSLILASCSSDDDPITETSNLEVPANYTFERNGQSTVDFSGQTTRILMAEEILNAFTDFENTTEVSLQAMYAHQQGNSDFSDNVLNSSDKNVRSKTAASQDYFSANATEAAAIKALFDSYISGQVNEVFPNKDVLAAAGSAGQLADGTKTRYVNANGLVYKQIFAKSLIGALMADQMLNNYLSPAVLDADNKVADNDNGITEEGEAFTTMEHNWDEAYGYLYGTSVEPASPNTTIGSDDSFLNDYVGTVNGDPDFSTIAADIFDAFKLGRAAIVAKDYALRDAQAAIIQQKISEVIAIRSVYYLQQGKDLLAIGDFGAAFQNLSEGYGFVFSLRFTRNPDTGTSLFSKSEVDGFTSDLLADGPNGFWDLQPSTVDGISEAIAAKFDFTVTEAASAN
ncbi:MULTISPECIES: DUF4856 domain-containing protein [Flavobacteriaceae]|uniref:DUF4856 domain-containing protein n=1 Tax=Euzebyella saccharophila TaxID=679664 RepID=A0ABV8JXW0_9FLAO|nr:MULTISPECIES: DUF4856 domain-containing protein [Flavobacteriaceae]PIB37672.1 DUF4856 domain-containing protein [Maribacter sp. 4G9]|tara:strand:+ start:72513 stop:73733 length:1221 start_codon:yes stop_codon:yes gene_type:complete